MVDCVIKFPNSMVLVFDEEGEQMPEFQGRYEEVRAKILAHAPKSAEFFYGRRKLGFENPLNLWKVSGKAVPREEW